jgi:hypothetical protein
VARDFFAHDALVARHVADAWRTVGVLTDDDLSGIAMSLTRQGGVAREEVTA